MGERTSYAPGTFCWVDLGTTDAAAAKRFYGEVFGWEMEDLEGAGGGAYTLCRLAGDAVAGLYELTEAMRAEAGPFWLSHVSVADADAAVARARELGGEALDDPFDVADAGRMAVLRDPLGAVLAVWQPRGRAGAERVNDAGCFFMNELAASDLAAASAFYEGLFGWETEAVDEGRGGAPMVFAMNDGGLGASFIAADGPPHWRAGFAVESCEGTLARFAELGGGTLAEPVEFEDGSVAIAADPQGAAVLLFDGTTDP